MGVGVTEDEAAAQAHPGSAPGEERERSGGEDGWDGELEARPQLLAEPHDVLAAALRARQFCACLRPTANIKQQQRALGQQRTATRGTGRSGTTCSVP